MVTIGAGHSSTDCRHSSRDIIDWQWGITLQQEVIPRVSAEVAYNRRWFNGAKVTDNTLRGPEDYDQFTIVAPQDSRLPGGGGYAIPGLYNITTAGFAKAAVNNVTFADNFGKQTQVYNGVLVNLSARAKNGLTMSAGRNGAVIQTRRL